MTETVKNALLMLILPFPESQVMEIRRLLDVLEVALFANHFFKP